MDRVYGGVSSGAERRWRVEREKGFLPRIGEGFRRSPGKPTFLRGTKFRGGQAAPPAINLMMELVRANRPAHGDADRCCGEAARSPR